MSPACAINDAPGKFPDFPGRPQAKPSGDYIPLGGFVFWEPTITVSEGMVSPESDHRDAVSSPERDEKAPGLIPQGVPASVACRLGPRLQWLMAALTRRREHDPREECWLIYYGDVPHITRERAHRSA
jgi:hypothetical protein